MFSSKIIFTLCNSFIACISVKTLLLETVSNCWKRCRYSDVNDILALNCIKHYILSIFGRRLQTTEQTWAVSLMSACGVKGSIWLPLSDTPIVHFCWFDSLIRDNFTSSEWFRTSWPNLDTYHVFMRCPCAVKCWRPPSYRTSFFQWSQILPFVILQGKWKWLQP